MTEGEFPFRSFTMRSEGYDRSEVDSYINELQAEIVEQRRARETESASGGGDARLHDPEGAVTRTLAIAQETADRVLHDAQVEADRRRSEADEHATGVIADADERAARLLGDMEAQAAEVREQGVAAARSAIQVERDKAMAELAHVRRVRDDLRTEAIDLKTSLDRYRSQAREAADVLGAAAAGPLASLELPNFIDDDVVLAGISANSADAEQDVTADAAFETDEPAMAYDSADDTEASGDGGGFLHAVDDTTEVVVEAPDADEAALAEVISIDTELADVEDLDIEIPDASFAEAELGDDVASDDGGMGGTFLAEVRAAAEDDDAPALAPENPDADRFLSELRGLADDAPDELDSDAADRFFDDD